jgi:hypothetical protein
MRDVARQVRRHYSILARASVGLLGSASIERPPPAYTIRGRAGNLRLTPFEQGGVVLRIERASASYDWPRRVQGPLQRRHRSGYLPSASRIDAKHDALDDLLPVLVMSTT